MIQGQKRRNEEKKTTAAESDSETGHSRTGSVVRENGLQLILGKRPRRTEEDMDGDGRRTRIKLDDGPDKASSWVTALQKLIKGKTAINKEVRSQSNGVMVYFLFCYRNCEN